MGTQTKPSKFHGLKGEVYDVIAESTNGISYKKLKEKILPAYLESEKVNGPSGTNLHATLLLLKNGEHVCVDGGHTPTFEDTDIFYIDKQKAL